jgi:hypothetical protein
MKLRSAGYLYVRPRYKMEVLLLFAGLISLWVATRLSYKRALRKWELNPIGPKPDPMRPGVPEAGALALVIGVIGCGLGVAQLLSPNYSPRGVRWAWLWKFIYANFGATGVAATLLSLGAILIGIGISALRRK